MLIRVLSIGLNQLVRYIWSDHITEDLALAPMNTDLLKVIAMASLMLVMAVAAFEQSARLDAVTKCSL